MPNRIIETEDDIAEGVAHLIQVEPLFGRAMAISGAPPLRRSAGDFGGLMRILVGQQISVAAAQGIWRRVTAAGADRAEAVLAMSPDDLRACGLSRPKCAYARALAEADLDYAAIAKAPIEASLRMLTGVKGVGPWTAEIYLMLCVGRRDVFAPGDLALQEATRALFGLTERPSAAALAEMASRWAPWRGVAARLLWAFYRETKGRDGVSA